MEVYNRSVLPQSPLTVKENGTSPIKIGDVTSIVIKERTENNEAKVMLKGQELSVKFDGPIPAEDRALVKVIRQGETGQIVVKSVESPATETKTANDIQLKVGLDSIAEPEIKEAVDLIVSKGGSVTKETLATLQDFFKNESGSIADKLDTIKVMQQKNIEFTKVQLHAVNTVLHGEALTETLSKLFDGPLEVSPAATSVNQSHQRVQPDLKKAIEDAMGQIKNGAKPSAVAERILSLLNPSTDKEAIQAIKKALQIQQAGKERIVQVLGNVANADMKEDIQQETKLSTIIELLSSKVMPKEIKDKLALASQDAQKLEKIGTIKLLSALQGLMAGGEVKQELSEGQGLTASMADSETEGPYQAIKEAVKLIQKEPSMENVLNGIHLLLEDNSGENIDLNGLKAAFEKASQLTGQGRELAARKELANAISKLEEVYPQLKKTSDEPALTKAEQYLIDEAVQTLQLNSRNLLVTEITKKLSQMAIDFKKMRQEMSRNLDSASRLIEANKAGSLVPAKQMLDATISKLDNAILKGNFMLYTDMTTEKKMLTASSKLAEAKNLLNKGNVVEANQIVKEVKGVLDKLIFKPSDTRVKHFVSDENLLSLKPETELSPKQMLEKAIRPLPEPGARGIFESIKKMGFTHEMASANAIIDKQEMPQNLKSILMKMLESDNNQSKLPVEQALANITGQQLLNKQDASGLQNMFLQLPILLDKQAENVKIYVNSQKKGEKIDWENCSLYFVLETKKLGEIGISISAVNRNLSITFKNNRDNLEEAVEPLTDAAKERLQGIGYNVGSIQFKSFAEGEENAKSEADRPSGLTPVYTEKGYDFSI